ncbi:MAG: hypothetical protein ACLTMP_05860 [Eggerthella lenta]
MQVSTGPLTRRPRSRCATRPTGGHCLRVRHGDRRGVQGREQDRAGGQQLTEFSVQSVTRGIDALGEVTIRVTAPDGGVQRGADKTSSSRPRRPTSTR